MLLSAGKSVRQAEGPLIWKFVDQLWVPPFVDASKGVDLTLVSTQHQFHSSLSAAETLAYRLPGGRNGYLGPTLVVPTGQQVTVTCRNSIGVHPLDASVGPGRPPAATHLHGGNTRPEYDGGPDDTFMHDRTYVYDNDQDAAGLWYHDQAHGMTRLNVYAGLAGAYLVRDIAVTGIDTGRGDYLPPPPYEIPLILQDRSLTRDGALSYPTGWHPEYFGDTAVVNGTAFPFLPVARGVYRFRLLNGSNARFYRLGLTLRPSGRTMGFLQIGTDGGLLNAPVPLTGLLVAPGERADLLVDFRDLPAGSIVELTNSAPTPYPAGPGPGHPGGPALGGIMQFLVTSGSGWGPSRNLPLEQIRLRPITPVRRLEKAAASAKVRSHSLLETVNLVGQPTMLTLDNRTSGSEDYRSRPVSPDTVEVWEFANTTRQTQPIHLHLVQFQVLNRQPFDAAAYLKAYGVATTMLLPDMPPYPAPSPTPYLNGKVRRPAANEMGWKDTVQAPPGMVTRIVVPFGRRAVDEPVAARNVHSGDYVWLSQILEHQDNDMVQGYRIA
jgi:FtsP/CotA-like multicopper oxidase with cupredoxin domain